jgi:hypothetical protein
MTSVSLRLLMIDNQFAESLSNVAKLPFFPLMENPEPVVNGPALGSRSMSLR